MVEKRITRPKKKPSGPRVDRKNPRKQKSPRKGLTPKQMREFLEKKRPSWKAKPAPMPSPKLPRGKPAPMPFPRKPEDILRKLTPEQRKRIEEMLRRQLQGERRRVPAKKGGRITKKKGGRVR